ncbi:MAG: nitrogenase cofactor biosynthesis protein NifB, partial [Cohaesibacter sp.]|nr:nitrogenase cofactor biosynthesis protein NifB [Cohaesibacter sp.]
KFDCANESRPGVVSEVLKPEDALRKVKAVVSKIPQLTVMGIAGPGDPLANPKPTFGTLRLVREHIPGLKLCLSTNGLVLPKHVDEIIDLGVDHVTITINCVDPHIGAKIYDWIVWEGQRRKGREAAAVLISQQLKGLEMLVARGLLVKINSVMIPGVNDKHLEAVSRLVKAKGAFVHNVMPLISDPSHGTAFGLTGQRGPTDEELQALR